MGWTVKTQIKDRKKYKPGGQPTYPKVGQAQVKNILNVWLQPPDFFPCHNGKWPSLETLIW
jgi:hypothetical protein